ncbi:DUF4259 domain-containing protein [Streptomyces sp. NPDC097727]|uniref:DUF4259 domain-containing protein n=1 Tax=Streptomyces sp. NPDC097727 TaxID=3366092 RepID=UPI0038066313
MGTWGIGPFDNDTPADFADALDETAVAERESLIRSALERAADPADQLDAADAERATAAAGGMPQPSVTPGSPPSVGQSR